MNLGAGRIDYKLNFAVAAAAVFVKFDNSDRLFVVGVGVGVAVAVNNFGRLVGVADLG